MGTGPFGPRSRWNLGRAESLNVRVLSRSLDAQLSLTVSVMNLRLMIFRRITVEIDQHLSITCTASCDSIDANGVPNHTIGQYSNGGPSPLSNGVSTAIPAEGTKQPLLQWFKTLGKDLLLRVPKPS